MQRKLEEIFSGFGRTYSPEILENPFKYSDPQILCNIPHNDVVLIYYLFVVLIILYNVYLFLLFVVNIVVDIFLFVIILLFDY